MVPRGGEERLRDGVVPALAASADRESPAVLVGEASVSGAGPLAAATGVKHEPVGGPAPPASGGGVSARLL
jgi:hypothetical protein